MSEYTPTTEMVRNTYAYERENELGWDGLDDDQTIFRVQEEFDRWLDSVKAEVWEEGVATALNYAKRGSDGISLKLVTFEGDAWANPYREDSA